MMMTHRLYASFASSLKSFSRFPDNKAHLTPIIYAELDDALGAARNALARGLNVHAIESDDCGTLLTADIERLIRRRGPSLIGRPRIY
jgi:hypothetical protein